MWQHAPFASEQECVISTDNRRLEWVPRVFTYQGIEHQSIKRLAVRVLHHDVEESIQSVLQKLEWQTDGVFEKGESPLWRHIKWIPWL